MYWHGSHLGHVTWIIYKHVGSHFLKMLPLNLALIGQAVSEKKIFECYCNIHVYSSGVGAYQPLWSNFFFQNQILCSVHLPISCMFFLSNDILTFSSFKCMGDLCWPCCKICQGHPKVIIYKHIVVLQSPMLHAKFH